MRVYVRTASCKPSIACDVLQYAHCVSATHVHVSDGLTCPLMHGISRVKCLAQGHKKGSRARVIFMGLELSTLRTTFQPLNHSAMLPSGGRVERRGRKRWLWQRGKAYAIGICWCWGVDKDQKKKGNWSAPTRGTHRHRGGGKWDEGERKEKNVHVGGANPDYLHGSTSNHSRPWFCDDRLSNSECIKGSRVDCITTPPWATE